MQEGGQSLAYGMVRIVEGTQRRVEEIGQRGAAIGDQREILAGLPPGVAQAGEETESSLLAGDEGGRRCRILRSYVLCHLATIVGCGRGEMDAIIRHIEVTFGKSPAPAPYELQAVGELLAGRDQQRLVVAGIEQKTRSLRADHFMIEIDARVNTQEFGSPEGDKGHADLEQIFDAIVLRGRMGDDDAVDRSLLDDIAHGRQRIVGLELRDDGGPIPACLHIA